MAGFGLESRSIRSKKKPNSGMMWIGNQISVTTEK